MQTKMGKMGKNDYIFVDVDMLTFMMLISWKNHNFNEGISRV